MTMWLVTHLLGFTVAASGELIPRATAAPQGQQQARDNCQLVTPGDAAGILGGTPKTAANGTTCTYEVQGQSLQLLIRTEAWAGETGGAWAIFQLQHAKIEEGQARRANPVMHVEPSLGANAVSVQSNDSYYVLVPVKKTLLEMEVRDRGKSIPATLSDKTRNLAKKIAGRL